MTFEEFQHLHRVFGAGLQGQAPPPVAPAGPPGQGFPVVIHPPAGGFQPHSIHNNMPPPGFVPDMLAPGIPLVPPSAGVPRTPGQTGMQPVSPDVLWNQQFNTQWNQQWNDLFNQEWTRTHSDQGARLYADWAMANLPDQPDESYRRGGHMGLDQHLQNLLNPFSPQGVVTTSGNHLILGGHAYGGRSF